MMKRKFFIVFLAVISAVCLALALVGCTPKASSSTVKKIALGDTPEQVEKLMGAPTEKQSDTLWIYYGKSYTDLTKKLDKNSEQLLEAIAKNDTEKAQKLFQESLELEEQLANLTYEYTEVIFSRTTDGDRSTYAVTNVFYDKMHKAEDETEKTLLSVTLTGTAGYYIDETKGENYAVIVNPQMEQDIPYKADYLDGSYSMGLITNGKIVQKVQDGMNTTVLSWSDKFGKYELSRDLFKIGTISAEGFMACTNTTALRRLVVPAHVIGINGVGSMLGVSVIEVEEGNPVYHAEGNCLIETETKTLVGGCSKSVIPQDGSVTSIGAGAFTQCYGLTAITIPNTITSIGKSAFFHTGLKSIEIPESVTSLGANAFSTCSLTSVTIPRSITVIPNSLLSNNETTLKSVTLHDGITYIGANAFWACHKLADLTIPSKVEYIGENAFGNCDLLTDIKIPDTVKFIGADAFVGTGYYSNENNWENGVLYYGKYLLNAKKGLSGEYTIKSGTVSVAEKAFLFADLDKLTIPESVRYIGCRNFHRDSMTFVFANYTGWIVYSSLDKENFTEIKESDLRADTTNYLTFLYDSCYWEHIQ